MKGSWFQLIMQGDHRTILSALNYSGESDMTTGTAGYHKTKIIAEYFYDLFT